MLHHTFCHIPGIGYKTEEKLWQAGITDWQQLQNLQRSATPIPVTLSPATRLEMEESLDQSTKALKENPCYFTARLSTGDPWRIFPHYREQTAYLDIETTGLGEGSEITTIALYDGHNVFTYVNGKNLEDFIDDIERFKVIVSYNGKSFDIPFLERYFRTSLKHAQIDLRYVLARLGFKGGLKSCEKQLGMNRGTLDGVDGYFAVLLWRHYQNYGDKKALDTLLAYNIEDTVNLERLLVEAYNRNIMKTPFAKDLLLPAPLMPPNPFPVDHELVARLKKDLIRW